MSCIRRIPYGYRMQNGQIEIYPEEAEVVKQIFYKYINGETLKGIAEHLVREQIEFLPGEFQWNKNRVKRILEDSRYTGRDSFGRIIDSETQEHANNLKYSRNTQKEPLVTAEKKKLAHSVLCGTCGRYMRHKTDRRMQKAESWNCICGAYIKLTIKEIEQQIIERFNEVITSPERYACAVSINCEPSLEVRRLENMIARQMEQPGADKEEILAMILQCASKKFEDCRDNRHITERLIATFKKWDSLSTLPLELYETVAEATLLFPDGTIGIRLKNQHLLRREVGNHAGSDENAEENCTGDTGRSQEST